MLEPASSTSLAPMAAPVPCADGAPSLRPGRMGRLLGSRLGYTLVFLACFALTWVPAAAVLLACDKTLLWSYDGLCQQYVWFVYTGQWLRDAAHTVFVEHSFNLPMWTMDSGFGADTLQIALFDVINPFYAVSALVPEEYAEYAFEASMLVQQFCAGLAFSLWGIHRGLDRRCALLGAVAYAFAGNMVELFTQPGFLNAPLMFPLMLYTADLMFEGRGRGLYVALMAWNFAYSFYDSYMMVVMLVLYCLVVFFGERERGVPRAGRGMRLVRVVGVFVGYTLLAACISAVLFLPQAMGLTGSNRLELDREYGLFYEPSYYVNLVMGYTTYVFATGDAYTGLNALIVPALVVLALRLRDHRPLAVAFGVLTLMLLLPICGRVMNAMQYATNRWSWAYGLCGAYVMACLAPALLQILARPGRARRVLWAAMLVYAAVACALPVSGRAKLAALVALAALALVQLLRARPEGARVGVLVVAAMVSGALSFAWYLAPGLGRNVLAQASIGQLWPAHTTYAAEALVEQVEDSEEGYDATYRYDRASTALWPHNSGLVTGRMVPDFYNSMYNDGIDNLWTSLGLCDTKGVNITYGALNGRGVLDGLLGVRYFYISDVAKGLLPFTFADATAVAQGGGSMGVAYSLYETRHVAPLAYLRSTALSRSAYESLSMVDRQKALLEGVVLEDGVEVPGVRDVSDEVAANADSQDLGFTVVDAQGCAYEDGTVRVDEARATLTLSYDVSQDLDGAEVYAVLTGVAYQDTLDEAQGSGLAAELKGLARRMLRTETRNAYVTFASDDDGAAGCVTIIKPSDAMYGGKHDWTCNLGTRAAGAHTVTLTFSSAGTYSFGSFALTAQPTQGMVEQIDDLAEAGAADIQIGTNELSCTVDVDADQLVFWSVAYSDGWTATVDGEPAQVLRADLGFMAVPVSAGEHTVVLRYQTPWLAEGTCVTLVGLAGTALVLVVRRRRGRGQGRGQGGTPPAEARDVA